MSHAMQAHIERITPLTDRVLQVILTPEIYTPYHAGQYLKLFLDDDVFSYSIANAPHLTHTYELHLRHSPDNLNSQRVVNYLTHHEDVSVHLPHGACHWVRLDPNKPLLCIAGGTGFAPIHAMLQQWQQDQMPQRVELFWSARTQEDVYLDARVMGWCAACPRLYYQSHVLTHNTDQMLQDVLERHINDLHEWQIVISGPFDMVYRARDLFLAQGVPAMHVFSDAFEFEKNVDGE